MRSPIPRDPPVTIATLPERRRRFCKDIVACGCFRVLVQVRKGMYGGNKWECWRWDVPRHQMGRLISSQTKLISDAFVRIIQGLHLAYLLPSWGGGAPRHSSHSVDLAPLAQSNPVWLVSYSAWASPFVPENCPTWFFGGWNTLRRVPNQGEHSQLRRLSAPPNSLSSQLPTGRNASYLREVPNFPLWCHFLLDEPIIGHSHCKENIWSDVPNSVLSIHSRVIQAIKKIFSAARHVPALLKALYSYKHAS